MNNTRFTLNQHKAYASLRREWRENEAVRVHNERQSMASGLFALGFVLLVVGIAIVYFTLQAM